ncbi:hypothetical protein [Fluviicola chungangensis]|uniref:Tetratricopeptide repeat protein n=1 Tax=Fluviicola chungangensis TaxID=2597671 RepID=A0A556MN91_9FLAO|nr:hypothetical protein [Fluviicola chungangensis]TSJ41298.1 hypothetical protein FO442_15415 [Fluviicola chungangensis]
MKKIVVILFISLSKLSIAQLDYKAMKDTICPSVCGIRDSITLSEIYPKLLNLDTNQISEGLADYYIDLSNIQYELCLRNHSDTAMLRLSLISAEKALYHSPRNIEMLWNAGFFYRVLGDCEKALYYLKRYGEACPKKYWKDNKDQIALLLGHCPNEELKQKFKIKQ